MYILRFFFFFCEGLCDFIRIYFLVVLDFIFVSFFEKLSVCCECVLWFILNTYQEFIVNVC